ncbi:MAG: LLM class flavin-dependent oxidoreductase [Thermomicrobium sp.]|nr:LLM class flavin-dependent oxidoreductase [Thermomicrobium sp.]
MWPSPGTNAFSHILCVMMARPEIPVGVRLPLASELMTPSALVEICRAALALGYSSFWMPDHVVLPEQTVSPYPHAQDRVQPFRAQTSWADPFLTLTWLAGQLPEARFGTCVVVLPLRNPTLLAKQVSTLSWLTGRPFTLGLGAGWLREEFEAVGVPFEGRSERIERHLALMRELVTTGSRDYVVSDGHCKSVTRRFTMLPRQSAPVEFLWGGCSSRALRRVATSCDGWLPAKQSIESLEDLRRRLEEACRTAGRDFSELKLVVKPGPGPDPPSGAIDRRTLDRYIELGFHEVILELPYEPVGVDDAVAVLTRVASRTWL